MAMTGRCRKDREGHWHLVYPYIENSLYPVLSVDSMLSFTWLAVTEGTSTAHHILGVSGNTPVAGWPGSLPDRDWQNLTKT